MTITRRDGAWLVVEPGQPEVRTFDKEAAKALANKRAREMQDSGRACQIRVLGEGWYAA